MKTQILTGVLLSLTLAACAHTPVWEDSLPPLPTAPAAPAAPQSAKEVPFRAMTAEALRLRLGKPDFIHREKNSQIWRYDKAACRVLFFLYGEKDRMTVQQYQSLPHGKPGNLSQTCREALNTHTD